MISYPDEFPPIRSYEEYVRRNRGEREFNTHEVKPTGRRVTCEFCGITRSEVEIDGVVERRCPTRTCGAEAEGKVA